MAAIDNYVQSAKDAGMTREQITRFISAGYVALSVTLPFHALARQIDQRNGVTHVLLDGTRGSAKSHAIIAQVGLDDCQVYPGLKWLFLRKTQKAASESFDDLVGRVLKGVEHTQNSEKVTFPNGSKIIIGGYDDDRDIEKYIGIEYDGIVIEEATQIKGDNHQKLAGSLRTSKPDWTPRMYLSTNPGGVGHTYIKDLFISNPRPFTRRFFSRYTDNPFINSEYKTYLESLTGDLAKAWRDGDWNVFAGQFFSRFRDSVHVINPLLHIPEYWDRYVCIDYGSTNPFCALWLTVDTQGNVYVYRELYKAGWNATQQAQAIQKATGKERIKTYIADPSMWAKNQTGGMLTVKSIADYYYDAANIVLSKANHDRIHGANVVREYLEWDGDEGIVTRQPKVKIYNTCPNLIRTLPELIHDDTRPEDVDTDGEDHAYDALRYGLVHVYESKRPTRDLWMDGGHDDHGALRAESKPKLERPPGARAV